MNRYRPPISFVVLLVLATSVTAKSQVSWIEDLTVAQQTAASRNQLLLLHFTADWCGPCQRLEKKVFCEPSFGYALNSEFVPCKINVTQHPELATRFGVTAWPTDVLLTPDGKEVHRMVSPQLAERYLNELRHANWQYRNSINTSQLAAVGMPPQHPQSPSSQVSGELARQLGERFGGAQTAQVQQAQFMQLQAPDSANSQAATEVPPSVMPQPPQQSPWPQPAQSPQLSPSPATTVQYATSPPAPARESNFVAATPPASNQPTTQASSHSNRIQGNFGSAMEMPTSSTCGTVTSQNPSAGYRDAELEQMVVNKYATGHSAPSPANARAAAPTAADSNQPHQASDGAVQSPATVPAAHHSVSQHPAADARVDNAANPATDPIRLGLDGYCPVTLLRQNQWLAGDRRWGAKHRGVVYLFQSAAAQQMFLADPDRFSPLLAGYDPVDFCDQGEYTAGKRAHGIRYRDTIILFSSEASLEKFSAAPEPYMDRISQAISATVAGR